jgi:hypothetical protein
VSAQEFGKVDFEDCVLHSLEAHVPAALQHALVLHMSRTTSVIPTRLCCQTFDIGGRDDRRGDRPHNGQFRGSGQLRPYPG